jgi:hypothetical protein
MFLEPEDNAWVEATEGVKTRDREARIPPPWQIRFTRHLRPQ